MLFVCEFDVMKCIWKTDIYRQGCKLLKENLQPGAYHLKYAPRRSSVD